MPPRPAAPAAPPPCACGRFRPQLKRDPLGCRDWMTTRTRRAIRLGAAAGYWAAGIGLFTTAAEFRRTILDRPWILPAGSPVHSYSGSLSWPPSLTPSRPRQTSLRPALTSPGPGGSCGLSFSPWSPPRSIWSSCIDEGDLSTRQPNMRLKLAGVYRLSGSGVLCPWRATDFVQRPCAGGRVARSLSAIR